MNLQNSDINEVVSSLPTNTSFDVYLFLEDAAGNRSEIYSLNNTLDMETYLPDEIEVYPNPILSAINIALSVDDATYKLTTVNGQILQIGKLLNGHNSLKIPELSKGLYFLTIKTNIGLVTKKIIKN